MSQKSSKTLIIQPQAGIGDYMWFIRHVRAIAEATPEKKVTLLTRPQSRADVLSQYEPYIQEVLWLNMRPGPHDGLKGVHVLGRLLKPFKFRSAWILHSRSLRYGLACRLAGIPEIHGGGAGLQKRLLTSRDKILVKGQTKGHPIERATLLLKNHGLRIHTSFPPIIVPSQIIEAIQKKLATFPQPWAAFIVGSSEAEKKWPMSSYMALGKRILGARGGSLFVIGGPAEAAEAVAIAENIKNDHPNVQAFTEDLWSAMGLLSLCDFAVGNDTGLVHATPMVGGRSMVLLGRAQAPMHLYMPIEGVHLQHGGGKQPPLSENNMAAVPVDLVFEKLKDLKWVE